MKKFFMIMAAVAALSMTAQTLEQPKFIDNTYVRIEGGATALTHPNHDGISYEYDNWSHTIQGVIGAEIGKWITPNFGVAFEGDFGLRNGSKNGLFQYMGVNEEGLIKSNSFNYITVTGLAKFNMSNIFAGWNPNRKVEFILATGPMWIHGLPSKYYYANDFGVKFKGEVNFNVAPRWQVNLIPEFNYNLTGLYSYGTTEHPRFDSRNSWYALKVGVTYKIGKQFTECPYKYTQADIDALNEEINNLRSRTPETVTKVVEKVVTKESPVTTYVVPFDYNSYELDNNAKSILNTIPTNLTVIVKGEASMPGSTNYNQKLSEQRASSVASYLTQRGVKIADVVGLGETGHQIVTVIVK